MLVQSLPASQGMCNIARAASVLQWIIKDAFCIAICLETCLTALIKIKSMEIIDNKLIGELLAKAGASARLRQNLDLRTSGGGWESAGFKETNPRPDARRDWLTRPPLAPESAGRRIILLLQLLLINLIILYLQNKLIIVIQNILILFMPI